ncbi:hypothetical protein M0802_013412 [Mischocyttarus mexicanus]|nr:hypothetical protein M0802_013412 [Mischocyttarus mexicanus]
MKQMRIFGEIQLWSTVEKDYDVAWTRICTFSEGYKSFARLEMKEKNLAKFVLKLSQKNGTWCVNKDYEIVLTANGTFYRNYKSSNLLKRLRRRCMDRKLHIFHNVLVFCPLGNKRKKLSIVCFKVIPEKQNVERQNKTTTLHGPEIAQFPQGPSLLHAWE